MTFIRFLIIASAALFPALTVAETFSHTDKTGTVFSAEVTESRLVMREHDGRPDVGRHGELSCPLAQDVRATAKSNGATAAGGGPSGSGASPAKWSR